MKEIFELVHNGDDIVVVKVNVDDPLTVAMYPYISGDHAYYAITKGANHTFKITRKDGTGWSFEWGDTCGTTLISDNTRRLKNEVLNFIQDNGIWIEWNGKDTPTSISIFYNPNFKCWEFTANAPTVRGGSKCYFSRKAKSWEDVSFEVEKVFPDLLIYDWQAGTAQTGIPIWRACL